MREPRIERYQHNGKQLYDLRERLVRSVRIWGGRRQTLNNSTIGNLVRPRISILTAVKNGSETIEQAILSVIDQKYPAVEHIVVDGGSTDRTLEILRKYEKEIEIWISEADKGIYDALNKGIALASGDLIGVLGSDDEYCRHALECVSEVYSAESGIIFGNSQVTLGGGDVRWLWRASKRLFGTRIHQPAAFVPRIAFEVFGLFDDRYRVAGDLEFFQRTLSGKYSFHYVNKDLALFRYGGTSDKSALIAHIEAIASSAKHFGIAGAAFGLLLLLKSAILRTARAVVVMIGGKSYEVGLARLRARITRTSIESPASILQRRPDE